MGDIPSWSGFRYIQVGNPSLRDTRGAHCRQVESQQGRFLVMAFPQCKIMPYSGSYE